MSRVIFGALQVCRLQNSRQFINKVLLSVELSGFYEYRHNVVGCYHFHITPHLIFKQKCKSQFFHSIYVYLLLALELLLSAN